MIEEILRKSKELEDYIIEMRRDFHRHPELKFEEERTSSIVERELKSLGFNVERVAKTGVIGRIGSGDKCVALRADMDALPIQEENEVPYKSKYPGKMHACGHDAHTAMLLGAAKVLSSLRDELKGEVRLIFQPAEEGGLGAKRIVEEGGIDGVDAIFGIHVWADLEAGKIGLAPGPCLASADAFKIVVKGKGGHGAMPNQAIDPIVACVDIINAFQKIISREVNPFEPAVLSVCKISSGSTFNVIPERAEMLGTVRAFSDKVREQILRRIEEILEGYSKAMRCEAEISWEEGIPPTVNDERLTNFAVSVLKKTFPGDIVHFKRTMGAEDFAFYARKVPGVFIALGIRNEAKGIVWPHHHPKFDVDESVLWKGTAIYSLLAYSFLEGSN